MAKLILAIIMFIGAGALIFIYVSPTYSETAKVKAEIATYQQALEKATEVQELKRGLLAKLNDFSGANVERLEKMLPDHIDNIHLVLDLDGMATARGLSLSTVNVQREGGATKEKKDQGVVLAGALQEQRKYQSVVLEFGVVATYPDMLAFMRDIERSLRLVDLVKLKIGSAQTQQQQLEFSQIPAELSRFGAQTRGQTGTQAGLLQTGSGFEPTYTFNVNIRTYWLP
jgi:Tfp pilus assembly protein PilO